MTFSVVAQGHRLCPAAAMSTVAAAVAAVVVGAAAVAAAVAAPPLPPAYADIYSGHGFYTEHPSSWTVADTWDADGRVSFEGGSRGGGGGGVHGPGSARVVVSLLDGYEVAKRDGGTEELRAGTAGQDLLDALVQGAKAACQQNVYGSCWYYELDDSRLAVVGGVQAASLRYSATVDDRKVTVREVVVPAGGGMYWSVRGTAGDGGPIEEVESIVSAFELEGGMADGGGGAPPGYATGFAASAATGEVMAQTAGGSCGSEDRDRHAGSNVIPADPSIVLERALDVNLILVGGVWSAYDISVLMRELPSYCDPVVTETGEKIGMRYLYEYNFVSRPDASGLVEVMDSNSDVRPLFEAAGDEANTWLDWWVRAHHRSWVVDGFAGGPPGEPEYRLVDALAVEEYLYEEVVASDPALSDPASANLVFLVPDPSDTRYLYNYRLDGFDKSTDKRFEYVGLMGYGGVHNMQFFDLYAAPWIDIDIVTFKYDEWGHLHSLHDCEVFRLSPEECFYDAASFHARSALSHIVTPSFVYPVGHHERYLVDVLVYVSPGGAVTITPASLKHLIDEDEVVAELEYLYPHAEWALETSVERRDLRGLSQDFKSDLEKGTTKLVDASMFGPERHYRILDSEKLKPHLLQWAADRTADRTADAGTRVIPVLVVVGTTDAELSVDEIGVIGYAPSIPGSDGEPCCAFAVADEPNMWEDGIGLSDIILHEVGHTLGLHHPFVSFDIYGAPHYNGYYNWYASPMTYSMPSLSSACGHLYGIAYDRPCGNPSLSFTVFERDRIADARLASLYKKVGGAQGGAGSSGGGQAGAVRDLVGESMERFKAGDVLSARGALQKMYEAHAAALDAGPPVPSRGEAPPAAAPPAAAPGAQRPVAPAVPEWVKSNAGWWADGMISDSDFVNGIEFLMDAGVIDVDAAAAAPAAQTGPPSAGGASAAAPQVPGWVKSNAGWWADGMISEGEFVRGIEFLVSKGIIRTGGR